MSLTRLGKLIAHVSACDKSSDAATESAAQAEQMAERPASGEPSDPTDERSTGRSGSEPCASVCKRASELGCKSAGECAGSCVGMLAPGPCADQIRTALSCFIQHPKDRWECDEEGQAAIKDGYCDAEQRAVAQCVSAQ
jgi:hypothetical protein